MSMPWMPILIQSCPVASFHLNYKPLWHLLPFFLHLLVLFLLLSSILIFHSPFYFFFSSSFHFNHLVLITTRACLNPPHQLHPPPHPILLLISLSPRFKISYSLRPKKPSTEKDKKGNTFQKQTEQVRLNLMTVMTTKIERERGFLADV